MKRSFLREFNKNIYIKKKFLHNRKTFADIQNERPSSWNRMHNNKNNYSFYKEKNKEKKICKLVAF